MTKIGMSLRPDSPAMKTSGHFQRPAETLVAALRKPLEVLDAAADEAAAGRLGAAKLGLLVAASCLIDALKAVDAEIARRYDVGNGGTPSAAGRRSGG